MKKRYRLLIILICIIMIYSFGIFSQKIFNNAHYCKDGRRQDSLQENGTIYFECGTSEESFSYRVVENDSIVRKTNITQKGITHIETYDMNWTDNDNIAISWNFGLIMCFVLILIILSQIINMFTKNKKK